jgi:hypothetical protein
MVIVEKNWWTKDWQGKPKYSEKSCPSATLSTTNPTWLDPGLNSGRRGGKPATNRLSYGAATFLWYVTLCGSVEVHPRFGEVHCLHVQGRRVSQESNYQDIRSSHSSVFLKMDVCLRRTSLSPQKIAFKSPLWTPQIQHHVYFDLFSLLFVVIP